MFLLVCFLYHFKLNVIIICLLLFKFTLYKIQELKFSLLTFKIKFEFNMYI